MGIIESILKGDTSPAVHVHYEGWNDVYDELIPITSERLASLGYYTNRDIPKYALSRKEGNTQADLIYFKPQP